MFEFFRCSLSENITWDHEIWKDFRMIRSDDTREMETVSDRRKFSESARNATDTRAPSVAYSDREWGSAKLKEETSASWGAITSESSVSRYWSAEPYKLLMILEKDCRIALVGNYSQRRIRIQKPGCSIRGLTDIWDSIKISDELSEVSSCWKVSQKDAHTSESCDKRTWKTWW